MTPLMNASASYYGKLTASVSVLLAVVFFSTAFGVPLQTTFHVLSRVHQYDINTVEQSI